MNHIQNIAQRFLESVRLGISIFVFADISQLGSSIPTHAITITPRTSRSIMYPLCFRQEDVQRNELDMCWVRNNEVLVWARELSMTMRDVKFSDDA